MKNSKKLLTLALVALTAISVCAGYGAINGETASSTVTIKWCSPNWEAPFNSELVAEFEAKNPGIKVEIITTEWKSYKASATIEVTQEMTS